METRAHVHTKLAVLFRALDDEGVVWCVLRGEEDLAVPEGDVDLLVEPSHLPRLRRLAARIGFASVKAWGYGSHVFLVAYDASDDLWIKLDIVTELAFGADYALATEAAPEVLKRRSRVGGIWVLSEDDAFWTLLLHRLLDKGGVGSRDAARLPVLAKAARTDSTLARIIESLCPSGWSAGSIVSAAARGEWASLTELGPPLAAAWRTRQRRSVRRRTIANTLERWSGKVARLSGRRGLRVALIAPDGAGKSTLTKGIEERFYFPVRSITMGLYQVPRRRAALPGMGLAGQLSTQWARWIQGAYHRRRGRLVLFDRYAYDALLPTRFQYSRLGKARRWLLAHACPPPELVIMLDVPGDVLYERKGEKTAALLETQRRAYRALLPRLPRAEIVDASREAEQVRPDVTALIWHEYARRWNGETSFEKT
jgi:thymidylate kinase